MDLFFRGLDRTPRREHPICPRLLAVARTSITLLAVLWFGQRIAGTDACEDALPVISLIIGRLETIPPDIQFNCYDVRRMDVCRESIGVSRRQLSNAADLLDYFRTKCKVSNLQEVQKVYAMLPTYYKRISAITKLLNDTEARR
jgi:hypothetical protein